MYGYNMSTKEAEAGGAFQGQFGLHSKFVADYVMTSFKKKTKPIQLNTSLSLPLSSPSLS